VQIDQVMTQVPPTHLYVDISLIPHNTLTIYHAYHIINDII